MISSQNLAKKKTKTMQIIIKWLEILKLKYNPKYPSLKLLGKNYR